MNITVKSNSRASQKILLRVCVLLSLSVFLLVAFLLNDSSHEVAINEKDNSSEEEREVISQITNVDINQDQEVETLESTTETTQEKSKSKSNRIFQEKEIFWGPDFLKPDNHRFVLTKILELVNSGVITIKESETEDDGIVTFRTLVSENGSFKLEAIDYTTRNPPLNEPYYSKLSPSIKYTLFVADNKSIGKYSGVSEIELNVVKENNNIKEVALFPRHINNQLFESATYGIHWSNDRKYFDYLPNFGGGICSTRVMNHSEANDKHRKILEKLKLPTTECRDVDKDMRIIENIFTTFGRY